MFCVDFCCFLPTFYPILTLVETKNYENIWLDPLYIKQMKENDIQDSQNILNIICFKISFKQKSSVRKFLKKYFKILKKIGYLLMK